MNHRKSAALACRLAAVILGARGLVRLVQITSFYYDGSFSAYIWSAAVIPFALFCALAALLWFAAGILMRSPAPGSAAESDGPPPVGMSDLTVTALVVTGAILAAFSLLRMAEAAFMVYGEFPPEVFDLVKQDFAAKLISHLAGFAAGLVLLFGGNRLSKYLYSLHD